MRGFTSGFGCHMLILRSLYVVCNALLEIKICWVFFPNYFFQVKLYQQQLHFGYYVHNLIENVLSLRMRGHMPIFLTDNRFFLILYMNFKYRVKIRGW